MNPAAQPCSSCLHYTGGCCDALNDYVKAHWTGCLRWISARKTTDNRAAVRRHQIAKPTGLGIPPSYSQRRPAISTTLDSGRKIPSRSPVGIGAHLRHITQPMPPVVGKCAAAPAAFLTLR